MYLTFNIMYSHLFVSYKIDSDIQNIVKQMFFSSFVPPTKDEKNIELETLKDD